jgi:predicted N-formylglutamate amidohydrolase
MDLVLTCEHATNAVPSRWEHLFAGGTARVALDSHRGWDPGAAELAKSFRVPVLMGKATRLLVEINRTRGHPKLWSEFTKELSDEEKQHVLETVYAPHWMEAHRRVEAGTAPLLHLGIHTFTPVFDGVERTVDVGLLYDPARKWETAFAVMWQREMRKLAPDLRIKRNHPYRGTSNGLITAFRQQFPERDYLGIELEVSQRFVLSEDADRWAAVKSAIATSLWLTLEKSPVADSL